MNQKAVQGFHRACQLVHMLMCGPKLLAVLLVALIGLQVDWPWLEFAHTWFHPLEIPLLLITWGMVAYMLWHQFGAHKHNVALKFDVLLTILLELVLTIWVLSGH